MRPIILAGALVAGTLAALPAQAKVLWRGDFSTGDLSQWQAVQEVSRDRLQVVGMDGGDGFALRAEVKQGDNPIHASGNRNELEAPPNEPDGSERWYHWQTLWPKDYPSADGWQLFTQFHHTGLTGSPPVELFVRGERVVLNVQGIERWSAPLVRGQWHDFLLHVRWSPAVNQGFVELTYDGHQAIAHLDCATMFEGQGVYLKQGLYRDASIQPTAVVFHRGLVVGETKSDVTQGPGALSQAQAAETPGAPGAAASGGPGGCASVDDDALAALSGALALLLLRRRRRSARRAART